MFYTSICTKVCSSSWMVLGMKLVTVAMCRIFKVVKILGIKYNKIISWDVKMFRIQRSWAFSRGRLRNCHCSNLSLKHVVFPKRMIVE
jgi:hypothetical protein